MRLIRRILPLPLPSDYAVRQRPQREACSVFLRAIRHNPTCGIGRNIAHVPYTGTYAWSPISCGVPVSPVFLCSRLLGILLLAALLHLLSRQAGCATHTSGSSSPPGATGFPQT